MNKSLDVLEAMMKKYPNTRIFISWRIIIEFIPVSGKFNVTNIENKSTDMVITEVDNLMDAVKVANKQLDEIIARGD